MNVRKPLPSTPALPGPPAPAEPFRPPSAEALAAHLATCEPRPLPPWVRFVPLGVVAFAALLSFGVADWWGALLPWSALLGVVWFGVWQRQQTARRKVAVQWTQELAMLRHHDHALRSAWTLLPRVVHEPEDHGKLVAVVGHTLEDLGHRDAAAVAFDHLLQRMPEGHPGALVLRVQKAIAAFESDHLADGDAELRKIRSVIGGRDEGPLGAAYHTARLVQSVRTNHFAEGVEDVPDPVTTFRPLGIDGAIGHGLLAYCLKQTGDNDAATEAWNRATLLLPGSELARRLPVLAVMRNEATA